MPIQRKNRNDAPADEDYFDEEKISRRPADDDEDDERPVRRSRRRNDDDEDDERPARRSRRRDDDDDEDDEDERPSRRRRARDDDDDDEDERPSRRSSRRSRDDDDDEEEELRPPRGSRRSRADDDEEDERPARRSRRSRDEDDDDEEEDERPSRRSRRSRDDDDEEDERPARKSRRSRADDDDDEEDDEDDSNDRSSLIQSGWASAKKKMAESSGFTNDFRFDEEPQVVKFLDTEPMVYQQHWIERKGKRSFVCLGAKCPLCKAGDTPQVKYAWPVLNFGAEEKPTAQLLVCGTKLAKQLEKHDNDKRNGPLDKLYWAMSKTGKQQSTSYVLEPVKERDLAADWDIDPDKAAKAVKTVKVPGEEAINITPRDELIDIARELR